MSDIVDDRSAVEAEFSTKLEALVPGVHATGVAGTGPVDVVAVRWIGGNYIELTYRDEHDHIGQAVLDRDHEQRISLESAGRTRAFDADADAWRLAAEALRIRYAALFDPMLAVSTSDLEALPHQIQAVYGELLPRTPLRFLLADDPGAGKTIMCGLYIKELMLRGDLARCLIVAPGSLVDQWQDELLEKFGITFEVLTRSQIDATALGTNVFDQHPQSIGFALTVLQRRLIMSNRADAAPQEDSIGQRPIHRDALRGSEGEVESRDRTCDVRS